MEIRDPIHGFVEISKAEEAILESQPYQRLRAIKQLGFSEFSYPGATHNRYLHSIGVCHLAGKAFDAIFGRDLLSTNYARLRQTVRLAALLHDIGHGPLSHTTEEVMPQLAELDLQIYKQRRRDIKLPPDSLQTNRQANHEDYTIKFIIDSPLTEIIKKNVQDILPIHIACLLNKTLHCPDDFFIVDDRDYRSILSQIVSSELDVDRMDYLERDAYFCGTNYGRVEINWLLSNMTFHQEDNQIYLALNRRALYAFDDFLLARHHMHLMVYFHHKSIIYEELLYRYLTSKECRFKLPADIESYMKFTDYALHEHLASVDNPWAKRIVERKPFRMLFELHSTEQTDRLKKMEARLEEKGIPVILANSSARLSKYHSISPEEKSFPIYVVDQYDHLSAPYRIEESTQIFQKYEEIRYVERIYVPPEQYESARALISKERL